MTELLEKPITRAEDGGDPGESVPPQPNPGNPPPQEPAPKKLPNDTEEPEPQGISNVELRERDEMEYLRALLAA